MFSLKPPLSGCLGNESIENPMPIQLHPLCVEEVLSVLFKHFSFSELKSFRTVCRIWEKEARHLLVTETKRWTLTPIILAKEKDITKFLNVFGKEVSFFDFSSVILVNFVYDPKKTKSSKFLRLLRTHGHRIKILHLQNLVIKGSSDVSVGFLRILQQLCCNLEKLVLTSPTFKLCNNTQQTALQGNSDGVNVKCPFQRLISLKVIQFVSNEDNRQFNQFSDFLRQLLYLIPHLEEFTYCDRTGECRYPLEAFLDVGKETLTKLTLLHLDTRRGDIQDLNQFKSLQKFKLQSLQIGIDANGLDPELSKQNFVHLLQAQQHTLTNLQLCFNVCDISRWHSFLHPNSFPQLRELNIPYKIFSFAMLKSMKSLKQLILRGNPKSSCWIEETDNQLVSENDIISSLNTSLSQSLENWIIESGNCSFPNSLHIRCEFIIDEATVVFFAKKFVQVVAFEFGYLSEDVLLQVYERFPNLKHLSVVCPPGLYVSSRAYLGESKALALSESRLSGFKLDVETRNRVAEKIRESSKPSILCLKELQRLELMRFGSMSSINRIHHSIECSSGFMFGISALQNVTELKLHPFIHKRAVMSLRLMPALRVVWAVPLIIGSRESGGRSDYPTTAYWYQVLLRKRPDMKIFVTTAPTSRERELGISATATRLLQIADVYRGNATSSGLYVYLDEYYIYQDGCEVPKPERIESSTPSCSVT